MGVEVQSAGEIGERGDHWITFHNPINVIEALSYISPQIGKIIRL
jgi:hypothetical protein